MQSLARLLVAGLLSGCASVVDRIGATEPWQAGVSMRVARAAHAVAGNNRVIYALGGTDEHGHAVDSVERFDGTSWKIVGPLPGGGLNAPAAAVIGNTLYLTGGFSATSNHPVSNTRAFDLTTGAWRTMTPMPAPRGGHAMIGLNGKLHVVGGGNSQATLAEHLVYDPASDAWQHRAPLPRAKGSPAAIIVEGQMLVIGGRSGDSDFGDVHRYDAGRDTWIQLADIAPRGTAGAVAACGQVMLIGGESQATGRVLDRVETIDERALMSAQRWRITAPLPTARAFARTIIFGTRILVVGGAVAYGASHEAIGTSTVESLEAACVDVASTARKASLVGS